VKGATTTGVAGAKVAPRRVIPPRPGARRADSGDRPRRTSKAGLRASLLYWKTAYGKPANGNLPLLTALVWGKPRFGSARVREVGGRPSFADRSGDRPSFGRSRSLVASLPWWPARPYGDKPPSGNSFHSGEASFVARPRPSGGRPSFLEAASPLIGPPSGGGRPHTPAGTRAGTGRMFWSKPVKSDRFGVGNGGEDMSGAIQLCAWKPSGAIPASVHA